MQEYMLYTTLAQLERDLASRQPARRLDSTPVLFRRLLDGFRGRMKIEEIEESLAARRALRASGGRLLAD